MRIKWNCYISTFHIHMPIRDDSVKLILISHVKVRINYLLNHGILRKLTIIIRDFKLY